MSNSGQNLNRTEIVIASVICDGCLKIQSTSRDNQRYHLHRTKRIELPKYRNPEALFTT